MEISVKRLASKGIRVLVIKDGEVVLEGGAKMIARRFAGAFLRKVIPGIVIVDAFLSMEGRADAAEFDYGRYLQELLPTLPDDWPVLVTQEQVLIYEDQYPSAFYGDGAWYQTGGAAIPGQTESYWTTASEARRLQNTIVSQQEWKLSALYGGLFPDPDRARQTIVRRISIRELGPQPVAAESLKPGEYLVTVENGVDVSVGGQPANPVPAGTVLRVLEIRGAWIGVEAIIDGKRVKGWILADQVARWTGGGG